MVADAISRLRTIGLYQDNNTKEAQPLLEDTVENILEELHNIHSIPTVTNYNKIDKLNLNVLQIEQSRRTFARRK